jgi:phosphate acetyltransferase
MASSSPAAHPDAHPHAHPHYDRLIAAARALPPLRVAVVHPVNDVSLEAVLSSVRLGLVAPVLVGPRERIEAAAASIGADLSAFDIVDAPHSHAAADIAVAMALRGEVDALMKGSLHTDELMGAVVRREGGLRTSRRISHCFVMDVPGHSQPLIISDAAINIAPTLEEKVDIVQNAIDLAHALQMPTVRVALLSATETVNTKVPSTLDAAVLCKMADRGQITGAQLDGPLAMDNAIDPEAARIKGIVSPVAGRANVLIVPDLDAGNMLAKSLTFLGGAYAAGIVLGTKVPVILTSRADSEPARLASCAVASMLAKAGRERLIKAVG